MLDYDSPFFYQLAASCIDGNVRLLQSEGVEDYLKVNSEVDERSIGRVEVCIGGIYSTVCDDDWDNSDASVACRKMGFSPYGNIHPLSYVSVLL